MELRSFRWAHWFSESLYANSLSQPLGPAQWMCVPRHSIEKYNWPNSSAWSTSAASQGKTWDHIPARASTFAVPWFALAESARLTILEERKKPTGVVCLWSMFRGAYLMLYSFRARSSLVQNWVLLLAWSASTKSPAS